MGLVPGGLITIRAEARYGNPVNFASGQTLPVNTMALFPLTDELDEDVAITVRLTTDFTDSGITRIGFPSVGLQLLEQRLGLDEVARVEAFGEPGIERGEEGAGGVALAQALPEPRQAGGRAQLERLGLLLPGDLQGLAEKRLRLLDRIAIQVSPGDIAQLPLRDRRLEHRVHSAG